MSVVIYENAMVYACTKENKHYCMYSGKKSKILLDYKQKQVLEHPLTLLVVIDQLIGIYDGQSLRS